MTNLPEAQSILSKLLQQCYRNFQDILEDFEQNLVLENFQSYSFLLDSERKKLAYSLNFSTNQFYASSFWLQMAFSRNNYNLSALCITFAITCFFELE